jgi:hypothetical protein
MRPLLLLAVLPLVAATPAFADVLVLEDGRLVEGEVERQGDVFLVRSRFGVAEVPAAHVTEHLPAASLDQRIREHLATLDPEDTENRALFAGWLVEVGRADEGRALARDVLAVDPQCRAAHEVLGHVRHRGAWVTPDEARRRDGLERHGDRWYTPQEWANLEADRREAALEEERRARGRAVAADVNEAVRLMTSPSAEVRARGRERLLALARELDDPRLAELAASVEAYVEALDEARRRVAAAATAPSGTGTVLGEIRATMSRLKRPIQSFETGLASNLGGGVVRIQLPELEVVRVRTTVPIPVVVR